MARYRELLKITARRNDAVNGWFICDRGRFANAAVNDPQRPRTPLVDGREASRDEALAALLLRIAEIGELYGPGSIAIVGSPRLALEGAVLLPLLAQYLAAGALCYFAGQEEGDRTLALHDLLSAGTCASQQDVRESDCIVICDCDPLQDAPMMALAVRQAWRNGARVYLVGVGIELPCEFTPVATLDAVPLADARRPVIICAAAGRGDNPAIKPALHTNLRLAGIFSAPNSFAAALLTREHGGVSLEEAIAAGGIKGIISVEADIPERLLEGIPLVAALDWRLTAALQAAQIVLPTTAWVEMDGTCINYEGRAQRFKKVMNPGLPIQGLDPAGHPPHIHRHVPPGGEARPAWQVLAGIIAELGGERITEPLRGKWQDLRGLMRRVKGS